MYSEDIERLRSMENLWKTRNPPVVLDHDRIVDEARSLDASTTASNDQATWNLSENFGVFSDRFVAEQEEPDKKTMLKGRPVSTV